MQTGENLTINLNNVSICYDAEGHGSVPLLFIHGFPFDKSSWLPQMEYFKSIHPVLAYDIRGFGKSTAGNEKVSIDLFADDLKGMLDALKIKKVIACGLSMGGYILLNAVIRYPGLFAAIILCDTQCIGDTAEGKEKRYKTIQEIEASGLNEFTEGFVPKVFCKYSLETQPELVDSVKTLIRSTASVTITRTLAALAERSETCSALNKIAIPTLIICGSEDVITPPVQSEFLHNNITGSTFHSIPNAGHLSNLEQPVIFDRLLSDFISGLGR